MSTTVTWQVNFAGDFTSPASALAGIGSSMTSSSSGKTLQAGSSSTVIVVAAADAGTDWIGHPISVTGFTTGLVIAQTGAALTVGAKAGYPANIGGSPGAGTAYTIDSTVPIINIGQSASGNNAWNLGTGSGQLNATGHGLDSTHRLTIQGATTHNPHKALRANLTGDPGQAVCLFGAWHYGPVPLTSSEQFVTFQDLQVSNSSDNGCVNMNADNCVMDRMLCYGRASIISFQGTGSVIKNSVAESSLIGSSSGFVGVGGGHAYGCTAINCNLAFNGAYGGFTATDCVALTTANLISGVTAVTCLTDYAGSLPGGFTLIATTGQIVSYGGSNAADARPLLAGALPSSVPFNANLTVDIYNSARPGSGSITAGAAQQTVTPPAVQTVAKLTITDWTLNLGTQTNLASLMSTDLTYFSTGLTCPSNAADAQHIVLDIGETSAVVGHIVSDDTAGANLCYISAYNSGTGVATVVALTNYSSGFNRTPQTGDAYRIYPIIAKFSFGPPSGGHTIWQSTYSTDDSTAWILLGSPVTSPGCYIWFDGTVHTHAGPAGTVTDGVGFICLALNGDHNGMFDMGCDNVLFTNLQLWVQGPTGVTGADGIFLHATHQAFTNVIVDHSVVIANCGTSDRDAGHSLGGGSVEGVSYVRSVLGTQGSLAPMVSLPFSALQCTILGTSNGKAVATANSAAGATTITVDNITNITAALPNGGTAIGHPNVTSNTVVLSISGSGPFVLTIGFGSITGAGVGIGDTLYFGTNGLALGSASITNCAVFGLADSGIVGVTAAHCATDNNRSALSGYTVMNYTAQFNSASGTTTAGFDARPKAGNGLAVGSGATGVDIYGHSFPANFAGAIAPTATTTHRGTLMLMGVG